jgi:hypothetical protein
MLSPENIQEGYSALAATCNLAKGPLSAALLCQNRPHRKSFVKISLLARLLAHADWRIMKY